MDVDLRDFVLVVLIAGTIVLLAAGAVLYEKKRSERTSHSDELRHRFRGEYAARGTPREARSRNGGLIASAPRRALERIEPGEHEVVMMERASIHGFDIAESLEPSPPRDVQIADVVGLAEYLEPTASASRVELERSATEVLDAAEHDRRLLRDAQLVAQRRLSQGRCSRRVVALLATAQRRTAADLDRRHMRTVRGREALDGTR